MKKILLIIFLLFIIGIVVCFGVDVFSVSNSSIKQSKYQMNHTINEISNNINSTTTNNTIDNDIMYIIINNVDNSNTIISDDNITSDTESNDNLAHIDLLENGFELPTAGASGYCSISMKLKDINSESGNTIATLSPGTGFQILEEIDDWWYILVSGKKGWVQSKYCLINLPDVVPSIIYDNTNGYSSIFMSSGVSLPNVTEKALYQSYTQNNRLKEKQFIVPVLYPTAKKICKAQQLALENNQSLKVYEAFRPYETQKSVSSSLSNLIDNNKVVRNGININGWNKSWFIAQVLSNHQRGIAVDVSLVDIEKSEKVKIGNYTCLKITKYEECKMPTKMHELSAKAVTFKYGVSTQSKTAWKNVPFAKTMTSPAKVLQNYFVEAGMYPIASEWWHFNDLDTKDIIGKNNYSTGQYYITKCYSTVPKY